MILEIAVYRVRSFLARIYPRKMLQDILWFLIHRKRCPWCGGSKTYINSYDERDCEVCNGKGTVPLRY
jgi:DnaJ-class molecular chaperone